MTGRQKKYRGGSNHYRWSGYEGISGSFINRLKRGAVKRKHEFNLTIEYLWELLVVQDFKCALSGIPITLSTVRKELNATKSSASLDRIDSSKGYIIGNVQWLHVKINMMKQQLSQAEFVDLCSKVASFNDRAED